MDVAQCCSIVELQEVKSCKIAQGTLLTKGPETMTVNGLCSFVLVCLEKGVIHMTSYWQGSTLYC